MPESVARGIQAILQAHVDNMDSGDLDAEDKHWLNSLADYGSDDDEVDAAASDDVVAAIAAINAAASSQHRELTKEEKRKIYNLRRKEGPSKRKDEALSDPKNVSWLRCEVRAGVLHWWCSQCHDHPSIASKQDHLANSKTVVARFSRFKEHRESASHKAVMDQILADLAQPQPMTKHIKVMPIDVLV